MRDLSDEEWEEEFRRPSTTPDGKIDAGVDMRGMVEDAFQQRDAPTEAGHPLESNIGNIVMEAMNIVDELENVLDNDSDDGEDDEPMGANAGGSDDEGGNDDPRLLEEAMEELYHGARASVLAATIIIMTFCTIHAVNNKFADQLFTLFREHLLPSENLLPKNYYAAKSLIQKLGLNYNTIHACQAGCVLFRGQYKDATHCPRCQKPRYKDEGKQRRPWKVLRHFPLVPRLRRMFRTPAISELMSWHAKNKSTDGFVRHPCDSKAWRHVHEVVDCTLAMTTVTST